MTDHGYLALVLHAHLPYVRHPEYPEFLEEDWLYEAITETYLPLLAVFDRLAGDKVPFALTLTLTPPLCAMLRDPLLRRALPALPRPLARPGGKGDRPHARLGPGGGHGVFLPRTAARLPPPVPRTLAGRPRRRRSAAFQDAGYLEIITCAATHGLLPLMENIPQAVRAQIFIARDDYRECFGRDPAGIWLPECAYVAGIDQVLQEANLRWFILDAHGLMYGQPRPRRAIYAPCFTPAGPAAFSRDRESSRQVWSAQHGYPGDPAYRDFYRDIGFELPPGGTGAGDRAGPAAQVHRVQVPPHHRARQQDKDLYHRVWAMAAADAHAGHFMNERRGQIESLRRVLDVDPIVVAPFDAELFGHWWFEGPEWLELFIRKAVYDQQTFELTTPGRYLDTHPTQQMVAPSASSWGQNGYWEVWLHPSNSWIYPHLQTAARRMVEAARAEVKGAGFLDARAGKAAGGRGVARPAAAADGAGVVAGAVERLGVPDEDGHGHALRGQAHAGTTCCGSRGFTSNGAAARWTWSSWPTASGATRFSPIWSGDIMFSAVYVWMKSPRQRRGKQGRDGSPSRPMLLLDDRARRRTCTPDKWDGSESHPYLVTTGSAAACPDAANVGDVSKPGMGQEGKKVPISFLPPPLETATYSLGIYDAKSGKLVRRLQEAATENAFTVGLNGLITSWDGKDDAGKAVPPGRYAARGYAVGALKVEGEDILGNDWAADDENLRLERIVEASPSCPRTTDLAVLAESARQRVARRRCYGDGTANWRGRNRTTKFAAS